ncbi:MAG: acetate--CoA ligase family protein [Desulfotalea sp.]
MLEQLFFPKKIAVIGASKIKGKVGYDLVKNITEGGYTGEVIPVNPGGGEIFGLKIYSHLKDYDDDIDMAIISVPRDLALNVVQDALTKRCRVIVAVGSGFKESGNEGALLEEDLLNLCRKSGAKLLGPNCLGFINTGIKLNASFAGELPRAGGIGIFSQSGALCAAMLDQVDKRGLGLSKMISIGNKADINENELLNYFAEDPDTKVIVGYLENIVAGNTFVKNAANICREKPVVILKAGTTEAGQRAATSHTGAFTGKDTAYGAAFNRAGIIRAESFDDLFDFSMAFVSQPLPADNKVLIMSNAGGTGTIAADAVEMAGLRLCEPPTNKTGSMRGRDLNYTAIESPVYILGDAPYQTYIDAIVAAQEDDDVNGIVLVLTPTAITDITKILIGISEILDRTKPVLCCLMGGKGCVPALDELVEKGLAIFDSPERAIRAFKALHKHANWRSLPPRIVTRFRVNRRRAARVIQRSINSGCYHLGEVKAKKILDAYGFNVPQGHLVNSSTEAIEYARRIGFPVALKIVSPDIVHKSDMGGVKLNLANAQQVHDGYDLMKLRIKEQVPNARIDGVYVEKMADPGLEVIIGMNRDPEFGPMLMFGLGGIFVEVMKDVTFHLAPITENEAIQMLKSTRSYDILEGRRGNKGVDIVAIANGLQRISQLATDYPQILELDINPFIVGEAGSDPIVADARITLKNPDEEL